MARDVAANNLVTHGGGQPFFIDDYGPGYHRVMMYTTKKVLSSAPRHINPITHLPVFEEQNEKGYPVTAVYADSAGKVVQVEIKLFPAQIPFFEAAKLDPETFARHFVGGDHIPSMDTWGGNGWACTNSAEGFELRVDKLKTVILLKYPFP